MADIENGEKPRKIANTIALAIERDIIENSIEVGTPLATEAELCRRYGASRWAIREAIAIVQNDGLVSVRRGRSGGAAVSCTPAQALGAAICGFLLYARMANEQIVQARVVLDRLLFEAANADPQEVRQSARDRLASVDSGNLQNVMAGDMFEEVLELSGSTITGVMALALSKLTLCRLSLLGMGAVHPSRPELSLRLLELRYSQLRAFIGLDAGAAYSATGQMASVFRRLFAEFESSRRAGGGIEQSREIAATIAQVLRPRQEIKPAGVVSTMLMLDAMSKSADGEGYLGSEAALASRYEVPRNMLREGIRILERDGFIRTEQGRAGGIRVGEPDETEIVARAIRFFSFARPPEREIIGLLRDFRMVALEILLTQTGADAWLIEQIDRMTGEAQADPIDLLFDRVARQTGNSLLVINEKICTALLAGRRRPIPDPAQWLKSLSDAVRQRDTPMARRSVASLYPPEAGA